MKKISILLLTSFLLTIVTNFMKAATKPSVPQNVTATTDSANCPVTTITWDAPASNGGSPITNYKIFQSGTSASYGAPLEIIVGLGGSPFTYITPTSATLFYIIKAVNAIGDSNASNEAETFDTAAPSLDTPSTPLITNIIAANGQISLTWSASDFACSNPDPKPKKYFIFRSTTSANYSSAIAVVNSPTLTYTDTDVTTGVEYFYVVKAKNEADAGCTSPASNEASAILGGAPTPVPSGQKQKPKFYCCSKKSIRYKDWKLLFDCKRICCLNKLLSEALNKISQLERQIG